MARRHVDLVIDTEVQSVDSAVVTIVSSRQWLAHLPPR